MATSTAMGQGLLQSVWDTTGTFYDPNNNFYFRVRHVDGNHLGKTQPFTSGATTWYQEQANGVLMVDGQLVLTNNAAVAANLGAIRRFYQGDNIIGLGLWFDTGQSRLKNKNDQISASFELLRCDWSLRGNVYAPIGNTRTTVAQRVIGNPGTNNIPSFQGNNIIVGGQLFQTSEHALAGSEFEIGRMLDFVGLPTLETFLGVYAYEDPNNNAQFGAKGGFRGYIFNNVAAECTWSTDPLFGRNISGGFTWFFGGPGGSATCAQGLQDKLTMPVVRNEQIAVTTQETLVTDDRQILQQNGANIFVIHVNDDAFGTGSGTFEDPFGSLTDADISATKALADIVYVHANSIFNNQSFTMMMNQRFLGEAAGAANDHLFDTDLLAVDNGDGAGVFRLPRATGGATAPLFRSSIPGSTIITLPAVNTEFAEVSVVRLEGRSRSGARGIAALTGANDTFINRIDAQEFAVAAVEVSAAGGGGSVRTIVGEQPTTFAGIGGVPLTTVAGPNTFVDNAVDVFLDAEDSVVTNLTSTGSDTSIFIDNITGGANALFIDEIDINDAGTGIELVGADGTAVITIGDGLGLGDDIDIDGASVAGIDISDFAAGSSTTLREINIDNISGDFGVTLDNVDGDVDIFEMTLASASDAGFSVSNSDGTFDIDDVFITSGNGVRLVDNTGDVNFNRDLDGSTTSTLDIDNSLEVGFFADYSGVGLAGGAVNFNTDLDGANSINATDGTAIDATFVPLINFGGGAAPLAFDTVTSTNATQNGLRFDQMLVDFQLGDVDVTDAQAGAGLLVTNSQAGFTLSLDTLTIDNSGGGADGVRLEDNAATSTVEFNNDVVGAGVVGVSNLDITTSTGTGFFADDGGIAQFNTDLDGVNTVTATAGTAISATDTELNTDGATNPIFDTVETTDAAFDGVLFDGVTTSSASIDLGPVTATDIVAGAGLIITNVVGETFNFDTVTISNSGLNAADGVALITNVGVTVNFNVDVDGSGDSDFDVDTSSGTGFFALSAPGLTDVVFNDGVNGDNTIDTSQGTAINSTGVDFTSGAGSTVLLDAVTSANAAQDGLFFSLTGGGPIEITSVATTDTVAGAGITIQNSSADFTFDETTIDNTNAAGGGVSLTANTGAIDFSGAGAASFLDIVTSTGTGFATNGGTGTVTVAEPADNRIDSTGATALNVNGSDVTLDFDEVDSGSVANPADGVFLQNLAGGSDVTIRSGDLFITANGVNAVSTAGTTYDVEFNLIQVTPAAVAADFSFNFNITAGSDINISGLNNFYFGNATTGNRGNGVNQVNAATGAGSIQVNGATITFP